jgi:hypothetical protein
LIAASALSLAATMKITSILAAAVVAVSSVGAVQWESVPSLNHLSDETNRDLHHVITLDGLPGIQSVRDQSIYLVFSSWF